MVQKRAKNTSKLHCSSHSYARSIIVYVVLIIQMHTIPTQAPPCVRATGYCRAMAQCALQNYSAQHSARYGSGSWVCNPMS